jgi:hypothetical protein
MSLQSRSSSEPRRGGVARVLTALVLLLTGLVLACYVAIFMSPNLPINPFPPQYVMVRITPQGQDPAGDTSAAPTFTPPPTFPPTWTPTLTPVPTMTGTPRPTLTPVPPTLTPTPIPPTARPPQFTLRADPIFVGQTLYPGASGWWTGVAGEVSDLEGNPVTDVTIRIQDNKGRSWELSPGSAANYAQTFGTTYGGGGSYAWWEQHLEGSCQQQITIRVQVLGGGQPLSREVTVKTSGGCERNLVLIHFVKNW